jgi:AcrR family transcriptional regulator
MPASSSHLRTDARHNRDRILAAARVAFETRGIDVPMAAIARRAGVGVATLYRRFPTRDALVTEVFEEQFRACAGLVDDALADDDPWRGFAELAERSSDTVASPSRRCARCRWPTVGSRRRS